VHERVARECARYLAVLVTTHAVGNEPQTQVGVRVIGILVVLAAQADMGVVSELNHARIDIPSKAHVPRRSGSGHS
jgi:hypothetical protein